MVFFVLFTSRLSDFQVRVDVGGARRQELGTAPATSKVVVRIQKHHHAELYVLICIAKTGKRLQRAFDFENYKESDDLMTDRVGGQRQP